MMPHEVYLVLFLKTYWACRDDFRPRPSDGLSQYALDSFGMCGLVLPSRGRFGLQVWKTKTQLVALKMCL